MSLLDDVYQAGFRNHRQIMSTIKIRIVTALSDVCQRVFRFAFHTNMEERNAKIEKYMYRFYENIKFVATSFIWKMHLPSGLCEFRYSHSLATSFHVSSRRSRKKITIFRTFLFRLPTMQERPYDRIRLADCCEPGIRWWSTCEMRRDEDRPRPRAMTMMMAILRPAKCVTRYVTRWSYGGKDRWLFFLDGLRFSYVTCDHDTSFTSR